MSGPSAALVPPTERRAVLTQFLHGTWKRLTGRRLPGPPDPSLVRPFFIARSITEGFSDFLDASVPWYADALLQCRPVASLLTRPEPLRILDLGFGRAGLLRRILPRRGSRPLHYLGFDLDDAAVQQARGRFPAAVAEFRQGDAASLPDDIGTFDAIFCVNVFLFIESLPALLGTLRPRLKAGGVVAVLDPVPSPYWDPDYGNFRILIRHPRGIARAFESAGFRRIDRGALYAFPLAGIPVLPLSAYSVWR